MSNIYKVQFDLKSVTNFLEEEQNFFRGFLAQLEKVASTQTGHNLTAIQKLLSNLPGEVDMIFPLKEPQRQLQALLSIAKILADTFSSVTLKQLGIINKWILLNDGYLGNIVDEDYEIAILLFLIAAIYQAKATRNVQTSAEYRYFYISAFSALKGAILFMERLNIHQDHYAYPFYQMLLLRRLEVEAEMTKSEAFIARKQGDFDKASKLFAGAASYRFSMMNFDLPPDTDNRIKIFASTELGMACFYIAVGLSNKSEAAEQSHGYLLKAKNYFDNAVKLSEDNTELLESANKRLDLVNPYIERLKDSNNKAILKQIEDIPDPQPLMIHPEPEALLAPNEMFEGQVRICSNCIKKIPWSEKCPKCGDTILPII